MENDSNVAKYLPLAAQQTPDEIAVQAPAGKRKHGSIPYKPYSFAQIDRWSNSLANLFVDKNITEGKRVLLMVRPGIDLILSVFALFKIGAIPVVIDPGMGVKHFLAAVRRTEPEALVGVPITGWIRRFYKKSFKKTQSVVIVNTRKFQRELGAYRDRPYETVKRAANDLAAILFTSGSTGIPKGVRYEHGMFDAQVKMVKEQYNIQPGERDMPMLPIFTLFNPALGVTTVVPDMEPNHPAEIRPRRILKAVLKHKINSSFGSPVIWEKLSRYAEKFDLQIPSMKRILIAGASASPELIRRLIKAFPNAEIHTPYGATEVLPVSSITGKEILEDTWQQTEEGRGTCVGRLLPGVSAKIIAATDAPIASLDQVEELPQGSIGEIIVTGPTVTKAYDRQPEQTNTAKINESLEENGKTTTWHRMGDLGYFDEQGRLWFCGRKVERVTLHDKTLYTDCVEGVVNTHPDVFRSALIRTGSNGDSTAAIVIEPIRGKFPKYKKNRTQFAEDIHKILQQKLPDTDIKSVHFRKRFPVDVRHNAKIHRLQLAKMYK